MIWETLVRVPDAIWAPAGGVIFGLYGVFAAWLVWSFVRAPAQERRQLAREAERGPTLALPSDEVSEKLELSDAYRRSRRVSVIAAGLAAAWALGQFEITEIGEPVAVILEPAAVPVLLTAVLVYGLRRAALEFAMQPVPVRRWSVARADFRLVEALTVLALLACAGSVVSRSPWLLVGVPVAIVAFVLIAVSVGALLLGGCVFAMTWIRSRQGRSAASSARVFEGLAMAGSLGFGAAVAAIVLTCVMDYSHLPERYRPSDNLIVMALNVSLVVGWLMGRDQALSAVFAFPPSRVVTDMGDGTFRVTCGVERGEEAAPE